LLILIKQKTFLKLALHAQSYDLDFALQIANLCDSYYKPNVLASIACEVLKSDIETAREIANSIDDTSSKIGALATIASYTHDEEAIDRMIKIVIMPKIFDNDDDNYEVLTNIASGIADNFPHKAIDLLKEIHTNKHLAI